MARKASDKRDRLAAAAAQLVAARGLDGATIAEIADLAGVAPGSVYYHLRSKEDIALAAVGVASAAREAQLEQWSAPADAAARLVAYLDAAVAAADQAVATGTLATLASQLRGGSAAAADAAAAAIRATVDWAASQFEELGYGRDAAAARALHLVTGIEGAGQLAHAFGDATPIARESAHLSRWVANSRASS